MCRCSQPQNPDQQIVQCSKCREWLHAKCLEKDVLQKYLAENPSQPEDQANGTEVNGSHAKPKGRPKKSRKSQLAVLNGRTEEEGVSATFKVVDDDDNGTVCVVITDRRNGEKTKTESALKCLLCEHPIDDE